MASGVEEVLAPALRGGEEFVGEQKDLRTILTFSNCMRLDWQFLKEQGLAPSLEQGVGSGLHNKHYL